jgi:hypothetical protein
MPRTSAPGRISRRKTGFAMNLANHPDLAKTLRRHHLRSVARDVAALSRDTEVEIVLQFVKPGANVKGAGPRPISVERASDLLVDLAEIFNLHLASA